MAIQLELIVKISSIINKTSFSQVILLAALLLTGLFHEYASCAASVLMLVWLGTKYIRSGKVNIYLNFTSASILCITVFYLLSVFWAVDSGMAYIGHMKFLPVFLYMLVLWQEDENSGNFIDILPYAAALMTVISAVLMQFSVFDKYFAVAGRLAGFFQYPNTFALFLLVSIVITVSKKHFRPADIAVCAVLLFGLLYTGSRTVFLLAVVSIPVAAVKGRKKPWRIVLAILGLAVIDIAVFAVLALAGQYNIFARLSSLSFKESTFVGRFLYYRDAVPLILKHPFGMGYMGYYYVQTAVQTGVYNVMYVHNDILQTALDIGWIPAILLAAVMIKPIFSKNSPFSCRVAMTVIFLHVCFDFDLQFVAMYCLVLLFCEYRSGKLVELTCPARAAAASFITGAVCLYLGLSLFLANIEKTELSQKLYPWNTQNLTTQMVRADNIKDAVKYADKILDGNDYVIAAYGARAREAYSVGDFAEMMKYKRIVLNKAPLVYSEYVDYCNMLVTGITLYRQAGDEKSAEVCAKELIAVQQRLSECENRISDLGRLIDDKMTTELPEDICEFIDGLKGGK